MVDKITTPPTAQAQINKINEIIDAKQDVLTSGTDLEIVEQPSVLPDGYTELECIESTGTQYIDTGIKDITNCEFIIEAQQTEVLSGFPTIIGAMDSDTAYKVIVGYNGAALNFYSQTGDSSGYVTATDLTIDTNKHKFYVKTTTNTTNFIIDDTYSYTGSYNITSSQTYSLTICARNRATVANFSSQKVYSFIAKKNDVVIQQLVPALRNSDNVVGMYDITNNQFHTNAGTGSFIAGEVVGDSLIISFTNESGYATEDYVDTELANKQDTLVSGTNIKTINGNSLLGSGDITIQSGASYTASCPAITPVDGIATWTITHNLGSQAVVTALYSNNNKIEHNTLITSNNALTVTFKASSVVSAGDYKIVILASGGSSGGGVDADLSNLSDTGKIAIAHNAMPSGTYVNLTFGASDTTYTAPADGWFYLQVIEDSGAWCNFFVDYNALTDKMLYAVTMHNTGGGGYNQAAMIPVFKNQTVTFKYSGITRVDYFRFIYAVGSESEAS